MFGKVPEFNRRFNRMLRNDSTVNRKSGYIAGYDNLVTKGYLWMTLDAERYINVLDMKYLDNPEWFTVHPFRK